MLKKLLTFLFIGIFIFPAAAQYNYNSSCQKAYQEIIDLRFDAARKTIAIEKKSNSKNLVPILLENYIDFLSITLTEDKTKFEQLRDLKKERLEAWETGPESSPYYRLGIAQINMQWAFARVLFGEYVTAAFEINQAYHLLEENKELHPEFLPNGLGLGVLHAMIGVVPEQYQWAINFLGLYGSIDQGLSELELILNTQKPEFKQFKPEALFLYTFLKLNLLSEESRIDDLLSIYQQDVFSNISKQSPLLHFAYVVTLMKKDNHQALLVLEEKPIYKDTFPFYYELFLRGQAKSYELNPEAFQLFGAYLKGYPGNNFKRSAAQKMAWSAFIQDDTATYKIYMQKVLALPDTKLDSDDAAVKEASKVKDGYLPNQYLLKSRILFDGGYLKEALAVLEKAKTERFSDEEKIELDYRKARIYHHLDSLDLALAFYQK
ncbi:MAG: hypothetical protein JW729_07855, partial [Bacteroidales bacterium]|nr:hypothetical protein [Bacteroidales bacterium]